MQLQWQWHTSYYHWPTKPNPDKIWSRLHDIIKNNISEVEVCLIVYHADVQSKHVIRRKIRLLPFTVTMSKYGSFWKRIQRRQSPEPPTAKWIAFILPGNVYTRHQYFLFRKCQLPWYGKGGKMFMYNHVIAKRFLFSGTVINECSISCVWSGKWPSQWPSQCQQLDSQ